MSGPFRSIVVAGALGLVGILAGCSKSAGSSAPTPAPGGVGQDVGDISHDLPIVKKAQAVANEVVRATGDCDAVKAALPQAVADIDDALPQLRTGAARTSLVNLKKQIQDIAGACP